MKQEGNSLGLATSSPGHDALWLWFGLSRAGWLTLPRVLLHEMPDEWQAKLAALLNELEETFPNYPDIQHIVITKRRGRYARMPEYLKNYRHPDRKAIDALRAAPGISHPESSIAIPPSHAP